MCFRVLSTVACVCFVFCVFCVSLCLYVPYVLCIRVCVLVCVCMYTEISRCCLVFCVCFVRFVRFVRFVSILGVLRVCMFVGVLNLALCLCFNSLNIEATDDGHSGRFLSRLIDAGVFASVWGGYPARVDCRRRRSSDHGVSRTGVNAVKAARSSLILSCHTTNNKFRWTREGRS